MDTDVVIIGGGIIGAACASRLARDGLGVEVLDYGPPRFGTSMSNAGHIVTSHSIPFAAPGMVESGIRALATRSGAFAIHPAAGSQALRWVRAFRRSCTEGNVKHFQPALASLLDTTADAITRGEAGDFETTGPGLWRVYTSPVGRRAAETEVEHLSAHGITARLVPIAEAWAQEPILTEEARAIVDLGGDFGIDPALLWQNLRWDSEQHGARWHRFAHAEAIATTIDGVNVRGPFGDMSANHVVVAAGAWSPGLVPGFDLPVQAAKGYSVTLEECDVLPTRPMLLADQNIAVSAIGASLRMSYRFELTSPKDRSIPPARIRALLQDAGVALRVTPPRDPMRTAHPWTGLRPATPDGAPIIGPTDTTGRVLVATGHGMLGTSMSVGTADLIARYVQDQSVTEIERRLGPQRFSA